MRSDRCWDPEKSEDGLSEDRHHAPIIRIISTIPATLRLIERMDIETMADQICGNIGLEIAERQDEVGLRGFSRPACSGRTTLHGGRSQVAKAYDSWGVLISLLAKNGFQLIDSEMGSLDLPIDQRSGQWPI